MSTSRLALMLPAQLPAEAEATGAPLSSTRVKAGPMPRMETLRPSPSMVARVMVTPGCATANRRWTVGELAEVFGKHGLAQADVIALGLGRVGQRRADARRPRSPGCCWRARPAARRPGPAGRPAR